MEKKQRVKDLARLSLDLDRQTGRGYVLRFCKMADGINDLLPEDVVCRLDAMHDRVVNEIDRKLSELQESL